MGYALEEPDRHLAETFPDLFRRIPGQAIGFVFRTFRNSKLLQLSAFAMNANPRVVLLTPGPLNETYFEHSYLARYLGFTLAQGGDMTVRDSRVFLKTLEGLKQVDVILRRVDGGFCDPIELRSDSLPGRGGPRRSGARRQRRGCQCARQRSDRNARVDALPAGTQQPLSG